MQNIGDKVFFSCVQSKHLHIAYYYYLICFIETTRHVLDLAL